MAREYMINKSMAGTDFQITGEDRPEEHMKLSAVSDQGLVREAEEIINERYHGLSPFPASTGSSCRTAGSRQTTTSGGDRSHAEAD